MKRSDSRFSSVEARQSLARIRRDLYGLLSFAYIHIPELKTLELKWEPAMELLGFSLQGAEEAFRQIEQGLDLIRPYAKKGPPGEKTLTSLSRDWTRLFRGVDRQGLLPPYESLYRTEKLHEKPAREIHRLFSQMGIRVPEEWHQPPDYVGVELDFMRLLCSRETQADESPKRESLTKAVKEEKSFVEHHLGTWASIFCEKMVEEAREDYYRGIARLTIGLVEYDRIYLAVA